VRVIRLHGQRACEGGAARVADVVAPQMELAQAHLGRAKARVRVRVRVRSKG